MEGLERILYLLTQHEEGKIRRRSMTARARSCKTSAEVPRNGHPTLPQIQPEIQPQLPM